MTNIKKTLDIVENHLQVLIENRISRWFTPHTPLSSLDLSQRVVGAIRDCILLDNHTPQTAPDIITIQAHPFQASDIWNDAELISELKRSIKKAVQQAGMQFEQEPELLVESNELLSLNEIDVHAAYHTGVVDQTQLVASNHENNGHKRAENAFLITKENKIKSLEDYMFTIGSGPENDFQIIDPMVEKQHAQLRLIGEHYVVFDLDTLYGTFVNQQQIRQQTLHPGDVITFGSTRIIYGENRDQPVDQTQDYEPSSSGMVDIGDD